MAIDPNDKTMTVRTIVTQWLRANGYDGLYVPGECCCNLNDLMPCNGQPDPDDCRAGHVVPCPGGDECEWADERNHLHIG